VGVRISPFNPFNDLTSGYPDEEAETFALAARLAARKIGYLHLIATPGNVPDSTVLGVREAFPGVLILAGGFERDRAEAALADGSADVVAFARGFIANPDLPERMRLDLPLASFDPTTLYTPGSDGYNDYPAYSPEPSVAA
ncbi:MAG: alkene reductase, partial [Frankiaceae bacterium]|nr:alkene reductase [Arenimonas sp.]